MAWLSPVIFSQFSSSASFALLLLLFKNGFTMREHDLFFFFQDEKSLFFFQTFITFLFRFLFLYITFSKKKNERNRKKKRRRSDESYLTPLLFSLSLNKRSPSIKDLFFFCVGASPRFCHLLFHFFFFSLRIAKLRIACVHCVVVVNLPLSLLLVPCWSLFCAATVERCSGRWTVRTPRSLISLSSDL